MPSFLFLLFLAALVVGAVYAFAYADTRTLVRWSRHIGVGLLLVAAAGLALAGRWSLAVPLGIIALSMLMRGSLHGLGPATKSPGQSSRVRARFLEMTLDHDSGEMRGEVVRGSQAGARLEELGEEQLKALLREVSGDPESTALLEAWLERYQPSWQKWGAREERRDEPAGGGPMTLEEAREILGVAAGADARQIRAAHRRLMKNVHPDQGGSNYLAAKLNEARDLLLKRV